jgi:hypothetical protein
MVVGRTAPTYQHMPMDTKAFNNSLYGQARREPQWGKNASTPYWEREKERRPSNPVYDDNWEKTHDYCNENTPDQLPAQHKPFFDPNGRNNTDLPGDNAALDTLGVGEGFHIWQRMAVLVRFRRIDLIEIMHARDPKDCNIFEQTQMLAALADVFGPQWTELAMTRSEFQEIMEPYMTRRPTGPGQPPAMIQYRSFCYDLQKYADEHLSDAEISHAFAMKMMGPPKTLTAMR